MPSEERVWEVQTKWSGDTSCLETRHASEDAGKRQIAARVAFYQELSKQDGWRGLQVPTYVLAARPAFDVGRQIWLENLYRRQVVRLTLKDLPSPDRSGFDPKDARRYILRTEGGDQIGAIVYDDESRGQYGY
jgi:hypothetical protein